MQHEVNILGNQTIYDIASQNLGGFDNLFYLVQNNSDLLPNIDADLGDYVGKKLIYDDIYFQIPATLNLKSNSNKDSFSKTGLANQSIYDMCLQEYGSFDKLLQFIQDSGIFSTNIVDASFVKCNFNANNISENGLVSVFKKRGYNFATLIKPSAPTGQGFLLLENTGYILFEDGGRIIIST